MFAKINAYRVQPILMKGVPICHHKTSMVVLAGGAGGGSASFQLLLYVKEV